MNVPRSIWYMYYRTEPFRLVLWEWCAQLLCGCVHSYCVAVCAIVTVRMPHMLYSSIPSAVVTTVVGADGGHG